MRTASSIDAPQTGMRRPLFLRRQLTVPMRNPRTFTLIELLVVVSIIAILAAMLLPALARARYVARHAVCSSNQKQLVMSMLLYASDHDDYYPIPPRGNFVYEDKYPIPAAWRSWVHNEHYSHNNWAKYVGGPFGNYKDITVDGNGILVCPQGITEVPWASNPSATHGGERSLYTFYIYLGMSGAHTGEQNRRLIKQRVGQVLTEREGHTTFRDAPLVSDHCQEVQGFSFTGFGWDGKQQFSTNHIWGGDRYVETRPGGTDAHFSASPVYWGSVTGRGEANFGMEDGSVRRFGGIGYFTFLSNTVRITGGVMAADRPCVPRELRD